jgi:hypothetical protein
MTLEQEVALLRTDLQRYLTLQFQKLGIDMPEQKVMEDMMRLIEAAGGEGYEKLNYAMGAAHIVAILISTGAVKSGGPSNVRTSANLSSRKG